mgnify:CR=1 FL=1
MIRNIIFDIGNVLTDYRWEGFLADKGFDAEMIQKIAKASVMHPAWAEYDRGTWTDEQVLAAFVKDAPQLEQELYQAFTSIAGIVTPRAYAIPWLQELKEKGGNAAFPPFLCSFRYSARSALYDSPAGLPFSFFRARATIRCAQRRESPRAAGGRTGCRTRPRRAAAPRRRDRT